MADEREPVQEAAAAEAAAEPEPSGAGPRLPPRIVLVQGLLKLPRMDLVVRQATEAGVVAVIPLIAARSLPDVGESGS
ncbi:MAG TPA: 16S rRNA (uracil(1498)-N(3))-methyltransferase, partial [Armatimonadota bacterium]|nr:16S rRNA (uracil(1498)-N(3))-methyltransferase [Armatimonadota bacterium]